MTGRTDDRRIATNSTPAMIAGATLLLLALIMVPFLADLFWLRVLSLAVMFAALAQATNLIAGFTGYAAFGNVVFFGIGSYATGIVMVKAGGSFWLGLALAAVCPLILVLMVGPLLLRLRGSNLTPLTGGGNGLSLPIPQGSPAEVGIFFYLLLLTVLILATLVAMWFDRSRVGLACRAIRDDELKAEAMGLRTTAVKTIAWALSAMLTGAVGGIYAYWFSYIEPPSVFDMLISIKMFVMMLLGGAGTVMGPIIAAFALEYVSTLLWSRLLNFHTGALGSVVILIVLFMPNGVGAFLRARLAARPGLQDHRPEN
jgi:branched-chain amino acid transport system permease protein